MLPRVAALGAEQIRGVRLSRLWCCLVAILLTPAASFAQQQPYRIEPTPDSRFALEVYKTGLMSGKTHVFVFERYSGTLQYDPDRPLESRVELAIESGSLVVTDDWVDEGEREKIRGEALDKKLAAEEHPEMSFSSTSVRAAEGEGRYEVEGRLAIRGMAKPVVVMVTLRVGSGDRLLFEGEAAVKMKDYGMKPPSAALGLIGTKNEMMVKFQLVAAPAS